MHVLLSEVDSLPCVVLKAGTVNNMTPSQPLDFNEKKGDTLASHGRGVEGRINQIVRGMAGVLDNGRPCCLSHFCSPAPRYTELQTEAMHMGEELAQLCCHCGSQNPSSR
ncbi:ypt homolog4 [Zea mays]|uniref:Ypt homolog4 n=1 Tax=Zea mays TaxID=4577 RepID=A0A1D6HEX0_MAIZE|nr:ypt homolog4 [Zea mays]AQK73190.1 ypt homolog4 [Zea mays]